MTKFMDGVYKYYAWVVLVLSLVAYFIFFTLEFNGSIQQAVNDYRTWLHLIFVTWLNVTMAGTAFDSGMQWGLMSDEFDTADKLNNQIIKAVNPKKKVFYKFIKHLNKTELENLQEDFRMSIGDKDENKWTKKEKRRYERLKPIVHDVEGFSLPLYYTATKSGKVGYNASINVGKSKRWTMFHRAFTGLLFGAMTYNVSFLWSNIGDAFASLIIIISGLAITFILIAFPNYFRLKHIVPKRVIMKDNLYKTFVENEHMFDNQKEHD